MYDLLTYPKMYNINYTGTTKKITAATKLHAITQKMTTKEKATTEHKTTEDTLMDEIASELLRELNGTKIAKPKHEVENLTQVTEATTRKVRPTLRIHLDGSTRYNIPFPENHAFCYTNPESILCRTP